MNAEKFEVRVTPYSESPITAVFDLTGMDKVGSLVLDQCQS